MPDTGTNNPLPAAATATGGPGVLRRTDRPGDGTRIALPTRRVSLAGLALVVIAMPWIVFQGSQLFLTVDRMTGVYDVAGLVMQWVMLLAGIVLLLIGLGNVLSPQRLDLAGDRLILQRWTIIGWRSLSIDRADIDRIDISTARQHAVWFNGSKAVIKMGGAVAYAVFVDHADTTVAIPVRTGEMRDELLLELREWLRNDSGTVTAA